MENFIQDIDISCSKHDFINVCGSIINEDNGAEIKIADERTKKGLDLIVLRYENSYDKETKFIAQINKATSILTLVPFSLSSVNYITNLDSGLNRALESLAMAKNGTYISFCNGTSTMVIDGKVKRGQLGIMESSKIGTPDNIESTFNSMNFKIRKTIKEYIAEEKELQAKINGVKSQVELLNIVARYALNAKLTGSMDYEDFLDIFRQSVLIGANDPTVLKFYQIVKI